MRRNGANLPPERRLTRERLEQAERSPASLKPNWRARQQAGEGRFSLGQGGITRRTRAAPRCDNENLDRIGILTEGLDCAAQVGTATHSKRDEHAKDEFHIQDAALIVTTAENGPNVEASALLYAQMTS